MLISSRKITSKLVMWMFVFSVVATAVQARRGRGSKAAASKDEETEKLLKMTGLPREKFEQVVTKGRRHLSKSEWDPRHKLSYSEIQQAVARGIVMMGPEKLEEYLQAKDSDSISSMWSGAAIRALENDLFYQWGPTRNLTYGTPQPYPNEVKKISAAGLSYSDLLEQWDGTGPLLLTDVHFPAMNWTKQWLTEQIGKHKIKIQMRVPGPEWMKSGNSHKFYVIEPLDSFTEVVEQTNGVKWCYSMDEEFFFEEQGGIPNWMKEQVLPGATLPQWDVEKGEERDLFQKFPTLAQPNNMMLLWGGAQSRSLLHVDPYNWTGTNGVIFGKKYWKFYPRSFPAVDALHGTAKSAQGYINSPHYFSPIDAFAPDIHRYPEFLEAEKYVIHGVQGPGEVMLIPSGWWHMAYNPVETFAFSSQFLNPQNYRPALSAVITGNPVVAECVQAKGLIVPAADGRLDWSKMRMDWDWVDPPLSPPYRDGARAVREFEAVMECLDTTMEAVEIEGKENLGKTSNLIWGPRKGGPKAPSPPPVEARGRRRIEGL